MRWIQSTLRSAGALAVGAAACLGGCAVGPDFVRPAPPQVDRYTREPLPAATDTADGLAQRYRAGETLPSDWWRMFASAPLDAAVQAALSHSPTLEAAQANLRQAQDLLRAGDAVFYPRLDAALGGERARSAPIQQGNGAPGTLFNVLTLSGSIGYPLDVFGGERRAVEALRAQVDYQHYVAEAAYLTLSANVVDACIARAAYAAQIASTRALLALQLEQLHSIDVQVQAGTAPYANLLSQRSLIAANQAQLAALQQRLAQTEHLLALLQGQAPANAAPPAVELAGLTLPQDLPVSVPSELVRRRPDLLAAEAELHAASAQIGVATAAMFPSFSLNATYGAAGSSLGNLFGAAGRFWSVGPSLSAPLFRGGALQAQRQAAIDAYDVQQANYRQTVLNAFSQVADALQALQHDAQALQAEQLARDSAAQALTLLQANYRAGLVAYVELLTADVQAHQADLGYLQALAQRHQDTVALFIALGGGWGNGPRDAAPDSAP